MPIVIKKINIPKSCRTMDDKDRAEQAKCCPFEDYGWCFFDNNIRTYKYISSRHPNCPISEGKE